MVVVRTGTVFFSVKHAETPGVCASSTDTVRLLGSRNVRGTLAARAGPASSRALREGGGVLLRWIGERSANDETLRLYRTFIIPRKKLSRTILLPKSKPKHPPELLVIGWPITRLNLWYQMSKIVMVKAERCPQIVTK